MDDRHGVSALASVTASMMLAGACGPTVAAESTRSSNANLDDSREAFEARNIDRWQANGSEGLWIEVAGGRWLYATFQAPCTDLPSSISARFRWSLSADLHVGASVMTAAGTVCAVRRIDEVKGAGSTARIDGRKSDKKDADLEGVVVEGRDPVPVNESRDVPRCGLRSIVWGLTRPGSAWRLITPVENPNPAAACLTPSAAGYRWSPGMVP